MRKIQREERHCILHVDMVRYDIIYSRNFLMSEGLLILLVHGCYLYVLGLAALCCKCNCGLCNLVSNYVKGNRFFYQKEVRNALLAFEE